MATETKADLASLTAEFNRDAKSRDAVRGLNQYYWDHLHTTIRENAQGGASHSLKLMECVHFVNAGLLDESLLKNGPEEIKMLEAGNAPADNPHLFTFAEWIELEYQRILSSDKKANLEAEIRKLGDSVVLQRSTLSEKQAARQFAYADALDAALQKKGGGQGPVRTRALKSFDAVVKLEEVSFFIMASQKRSAAGEFLAPEKRRELVALGAEQKKLAAVYQAALSELPPASAKEIKALDDAISVLAGEIAAREIKKEKAERDLARGPATGGLSAMDIEAKLAEFVDYFKDLMTLTAKRLRAEPMSAWISGAVPATRLKLKDVLARVEEFDPRAFNNSRVKYQGLPKFVIMPGHGHGLYDWKNNAVIVPAFPAGSLEGAVFAGLIEYRLDSDEDKRLLTSYGKIKENEGIKSPFRLKEKLALDYGQYMMEETRGYKVLPTDKRQWFWSEIAPRRNEIKLPHRYDPTMVQPKDLDALRISLKAKSDSVDALYGLGVMEAAAEAFDPAIQYFQTALAKVPGHLDSLYNLGICFLKKHRNREAMECFSDFLKKSPQSFWTTVCQEYILKLR